MQAPIRPTPLPFKENYSLVGWIVALTVVIGTIVLAVIASMPGDNALLVQGGCCGLVVVLGLVVLLAASHGTRRTRPGAAAPPPPQQVPWYPPPPTRPVPPPPAPAESGLPPWPTSCGVCGCDLRPNARFCSACGSPVPKP